MRYRHDGERLLRQFLPGVGVFRPFLVALVVLAAGPDHIEIILLFLKRVVHDVHPQRLEIRILLPVATSVRVLDEAIAAAKLPGIGQRVAIGPLLVVLVRVGAVQPLIKYLEDGARNAFTYGYVARTHCV